MLKTSCYILFCVVIFNLFCGCDYDADEAALPKNMHNLTNTDITDEFFPSWSPDGMKIAFITQSGWSIDGISVMDANGKNRRELIEADAFFHLSWSPDSKRIAFGNNDDCITIIDADGKNQSNLASFRGAQSPSWSPNGQSIVFGCYQGTSYNPFPNADYNYDICIMDIDGKNQRNLTSSPECEVDPSWSSDGQSIAFSRYKGNWDIYVMGADGSNQRNVTNSRERDEEEPSWSPDGMKIAFTASHKKLYDNYYFKISVMNIDGKDQRDLVNISHWKARSPSWSPDGKKIAFSFYHYPSDEPYWVEDIYTVDDP